jgi:hypothetical protein
MHGYAVTAHRSQGKSVDSVVISADGMRKELFYVAASRGREGITVVTSDKERLTHTVAQTAARKSASELVCGSRQRGLSMARELIRSAIQFVSSVHERLLPLALNRRKENNVNIALVDKSPWTITTESPLPALEVVLPKQTLILAWNQFV